MGDGTCQVPQPGVAMVYPACPAAPPLSYQDRGGAAAPYVAPTPVPRPACSYDPNPFVANSAQCVAQLLAAQQGNFQVDNDANRAVFVADCLATFPQPPDCLTRTYGQTPAGGFTSDGQAGGPQLIEDAFGHVVNESAPAPAPAPVSAGGPTGVKTQAPPPTPTSSYVPTAPDALAQLVNGGGVSLAGFQIPWLGLAAAGVGLLFLARAK